MRFNLYENILRSPDDPASGGGGVSPPASPAGGAPAGGDQSPAGGTPPAPAPVAAPAPAPAGAPAAPVDPSLVVPATADGYNLAFPEGVTIDAPTVSAFKQAAKELGLTPAAAQKIADIQVQSYQRAVESHGTMVAQWADDTARDPEIAGPNGANFDRNISLANRALTEVGTPALTKLLREHGLGNHPEIIRHFMKLGKDLGEAPAGQGGGSPGGNGLSAAQVLYGEPSSR